MAWYAYCVTEKQTFPELLRHRKPVPLPHVTGIEGNQVFLYPASDLAVVVSEYIPSENSSSRHAKDHARVIAACFESGGGGAVGVGGGVAHFPGRGRRITLCKVCSAKRTRRRLQQRSSGRFQPDVPALGLIGPFKRVCEGFRMHSFEIGHPERSEGPALFAMPEKQVLSSTQNDSVFQNGLELGSKVYRLPLRASSRALSLSRRSAPARSTLRQNAQK